MSANKIEKKKLDFQGFHFLDNECDERAEVRHLRQHCPGEFGGITAKECVKLPAGCCFGSDNGPPRDTLVLQQM